MLAAFGHDTADIAGRDIGRYAITSAGLALVVGLVTAITGTVAAWLVAMHSFPGRQFFAWALALPLAVPAFVLAYSYADIFDVAGSMRTGLRNSLGFDPGFSMRNSGGAAFVLSAAFYPYVYLAMRSAFINQSVNVLEAAAVLGCRGRQTLWRVALPMARPALVAGVALAVMEVLADYGAVHFLSVQTLTTGIVRAWSIYGSTGSAARFALPLLATAAILLWLERASRKGRSHETGGSRWRAIEPQPLGLAAGWLAAGYCGFLLTAGLLLPVGWLIWNLNMNTPDWERLLSAMQNSALLSIAGAALTVLLATVIALGTRQLPLVARLASLGYATPGAVMAIGLLAPAGVIWTMTPGSGAQIAIILLLLAYAARLMAAALEPIAAGLTRVTPSMISAARTLGRTETAAAVAVDLPIARGAMFTAGLIVFVDILKELPATLILRPFNFDTLAVISNNFATDERLSQAGLPSLMILVLSLPAVWWLTWRIASARPGT